VVCALISPGTIAPVALPSRNQPERKTVLRESQLQGQGPIQLAANHDCSPPVGTAIIEISTSASGTTVGDDWPVRAVFRPEPARLVHRGEVVGGLQVDGPPPPGRATIRPRQDAQLLITRASFALDRRGWCLTVLRHRASEATVRRT
jgi:hypothetical protein